MGHFTAGSLINLALLSSLAAQQQSEKVEFEVVSIKPGDPAAPGRTTQQTQGGIRCRNLRLFELVMSAWHLNRDQIAGGPNWLETAGWDIDARFPAGASPAQAPLMMQAMLADRFHLVTHRETRMLPVYTLTVAKAESNCKKATAAEACPRGRASSAIDRGPCANLPGSCPAISAAR